MKKPHKRLIILLGIITSLFFVFLILKFSIWESYRNKVVNDSWKCSASIDTYFNYVEILDEDINVFSSEKWISDVELGIKLIDKYCTKRGREFLVPKEFQSGNEYLLLGNNEYLEFVRINRESLAENNFDKFLQSLQHIYFAGTYSRKASELFPQSP